MIVNLGSAQFLDYIETVMAKLLDCVKDDSRMVAQKTEEALEALISAIQPPQRCLQVLIPIIISETAPVLQASIRCVNSVISIIQHCLASSVLTDLFCDLYTGHSRSLCRVWR